MVEEWEECEYNAGKGKKMGQGGVTRGNVMIWKNEGKCGPHNFPVPRKNMLSN